MDFKDNFERLEERSDHDIHFFLQFDLHKFTLSFLIFTVIVILSFDKHEKLRFYIRRKQGRNIYE